MMWRKVLRITICGPIVSTGALLHSRWTGRTGGAAGSTSQVRLPPNGSRTCGGVLTSLWMSTYSVNDGLKMARCVPSVRDTRVSPVPSSPMR